MGEYDDLKAAMKALENIPSGGIGAGGPTLEELYETENCGGVWCRDANYHHAQET